MKTFFRILETVVRPFFIYILIMNLNFQVVNGEEKDSTFFSTVDLPAYNSEISLVERLNQTGIKYEVNSLENYSSYESNYVLTIGNQEGTRKIYVVTPVSGEKNSKTIDTVVNSAVILSRNYAENRDSFPPDTCYKFIFSGGNSSKLPTSLFKPRYSGIQAVGDSIDTTIPVAVLLITPPDENASKDAPIEIIHGGANKTAPLWLLRSVINTDEELYMFSSLYNTKNEMYRLGWISGEPLLNIFLERDIPSILLKLDPSVQKISKDSFFIARAAFDVSKVVSLDWDMHYIFFSFFGYNIYIREQMLVLGITIITLLFLGAISLLAFTFSSRRKENISSLKKTWWIIPLFMLITYYSLTGGKFLVYSLFNYKLGSSEGWTLMPFFSIAFKMVVSIAMITACTILMQLITLPQDNYIYGMYSGMISLCNIFIFAALDFSITSSFLFSFIMIFIFYHCKSKRASLVFLVFSVLPFFTILPNPGKPDFTRILFFDEIFLGEKNWDFLLCFFLLPYEMAFIRINAMAKTLGKTEKFRIPWIALLLFLTTAGFGIYFFVKEPFTEKNPQPVLLQELYSEKSSQILITSPYKINSGTLFLNGKNEEIVFDSYHAGNYIYTKKIENDNFINVGINKNNYLDRTIFHLDFVPEEKIKVIKYIIKIENNKGIAVYDTNMPYTLEEGGYLCRIETGEFPPENFNFEFSSGKDSDLTIYICAYIENSNNKINFTGTNPISLDKICSVKKTIYLGDKAHE